jgi:hypothetical protein
MQNRRSKKSFHKNFITTIFVVISFTNKSHSLWIPNSSFSSNPLNFNQSYAIQKCTPSGLHVQELKLEYSHRFQNSNRYAVGWFLKSQHQVREYQKPLLGGEVFVARCLPPGKWTILGAGEVERVNGNLIEASIVGTHNPFDGKDPGLNEIPKSVIEFGNFYWRPMVGDRVFPIQKTLFNKLSITPKIELDTQELFVHLGNQMYSYDLSDHGKKILEKKFRLFENKRGRLLIEGFVSSPGDKEELRIESLIRAQTVQKYFINTFQLHSSQIIAVGYGSDGLQTGMVPIKMGPNQKIMNGVRLKMILSYY